MKRLDTSSQERDPVGSGLWGAKAQLRGAALLGKGFFVNTVGRDEEAVPAYIRNQEKEDQRLEQINLWR
jgi:putative transposase